MLKKTISYKDFDGNMRVEDFYFNLTKAELVEMELGHEGGTFSDHLIRMVNSTDGKVIIETFKGILEKAYGVRSEDGKRFIKSPELWQAFLETAAYSELFIELVTDADKSAEFIKAIVPTDLTPPALTTIEGVQFPSEESQLEALKKQIAELQAKNDA
jgi:hypothetical protein